MYTGENSLRSINAYLIGYNHALYEHKLLKLPDYPDEFFDWVANKLGFRESTAGWVNMILAVSLGLNSKSIEWEKLLNRYLTKEEHEKSIQFFYRLLEEYINESKI